MNRELRSLHLAAVLVCVTVHDAKAQIDTIESLSAPGIDRETALRTREGQPYDPHAISEDVRTLYRAGRFSDIRVEVQQGSRGKRIAFHVVGSRRLMLRAARTSVQFSLASRLPSKGQGLLELSSWYASFNLYAYRGLFSLAVGGRSTS